LKISEKNDFVIKLEENKRNLKLQKQKNEFEKLEKEREQSKKGKLFKKNVYLLIF